MNLPNIYCWKLFRKNKIHSFGAAFVTLKIYPWQKSFQGELQSGASESTHSSFYGFFIVFQYNQNWKHASSQEHQMAP